jgi:hypothetical protein
MNLKLLCLLFDPSLTVQQTDTCRGSSAPLKFQSYSRFQPTFVSSPYFCVLIPTLVGENCRRSETTASLLGFLTCRSTNRFWLRELCYVEVGCLPLFSSSGLAFQPTTVSLYWNWWRKFSYLLKLLYPLLHSPLAEPQTGFYRESSGMSKFDDCSCFFFFKPGLTLLPTTMFCWCHWWEKVSKHMKLLHPLLHSPLANPQINLYRESSAT